MHALETLERINAEWPNPLSNRERRRREKELAIQHLENRLGVVVDRDDPMLGAMASLEMSLLAWASRQR